MRRTIATAVALACLALPAGAAASAEQESIFQEDPLIVYHRSYQQLLDTLSAIKNRGADRIRVPVFWHELAPKPGSRRQPRFRRGPASPASYNRRFWERYDQVVKTADALGLGVLFTISGSTPIWARQGSRRRPLPYPRLSHLRNFTRAVGTRYSGSYPDPSGARPVLPRVTHWSAWNEPNFLQFDYRALLRKRGGARTRPMTPDVYRAVVDAIYAGLRRSGHGSDVFLLGETAPRRGGRRDPNGTIPPLEFIRGVYCVDARFRPQRSCRRNFARRHPGLFRSAGWAHHPYTVNLPPSWDDRFRKAVPISALGRMVDTLDRALFRWGGAEVPVWVTEYGIQTNPPDPNLDITPDEQAAYLAESEFITYSNPRVASTGWFLLVDDRPRRFPRGRRGRLRRWVTWQSGLITRQGVPKPAFDEYHHPIHVVASGGGQRVFGQYRVAFDGAAIPARIEFLPSGGTAWQGLQALTVTNLKGYLDTQVTAPGPGALRIVWTDPVFGVEVPSRAVPVS
jgi:hypothetical protein